MSSAGSIHAHAVVHLPHSLLVDLGHARVVHHGYGVIPSHDALRAFLHLLWCRPGLVDVARGKVLEDGQEAADEIPVGVCPPPELDWTIEVEELLEKG